MAELNSTILASAYINASNDYQQRVPQATQHDIAKTVDFLFEPMNKKYLNEFMDILINRIATTYVRSKRWDNPLKVFKGEKIPYGDTIQEIALNWIEAHAYQDDVTDLLKMERPDGSVAYHSQNRQDKYKISVSYDELRTAFLSDYGINDFIAKIMDVPLNSDNYDEYKIMLQLIAEYENQWGFYKANLSAAPTSEATAKAFLKDLRTLGGKLQFPTTVYNAQSVDNVPVFAKPDELVLLTTPEALASIDVDALAVLFNVDKAEIKYRTIMVDEFPVPDAVALLTTEDFFVCNDTVYNNTSFFDPNTLVTHYWLHHWGIYSVTPYVPAILFTTDAGSTVETATQTISAFSLTAADDEVKRGGTLQLTPALTGSISGDGSGDLSRLTVMPQAATYEIVGAIEVTEPNCEKYGDDPEPEPVYAPVQLKRNTYVDEFNVLHVAKTEPAGAILTITAKSTYINPSGDTTEYTDDVVIDVI